RNQSLTDLWLTLNPSSHNIPATLLRLSPSTYSLTPRALTHGGVLRRGKTLLSPKKPIRRPRPTPTLSTHNEWEGPGHRP
ncbi:MAG: hypothetical protein NDP22_01040, partial [Crenarchaeota archaeon]|nr:hypothetical protein [Thermoproteota archaeon]